MEREFLWKVLSPAEACRGECFSVRDPWDALGFSGSVWLVMISAGAVCWADTGKHHFSPSRWDSQHPNRRRTVEKETERVQALVSLESTQFLFCCSLYLLLFQCGLNVSSHWEWCRKMHILHGLHLCLLQHAWHFSVTCYFALAELLSAFLKMALHDFQMYSVAAVLETHGRKLICSSCQFRLSQLSHTDRYQPQEKK